MTRFLIFFLLFYLVFRYFIRPFFEPKHTAGKEKKKHYPRDGEIRVNYKPPPEKGDENKGEYVDYEEIK